MKKIAIATENGKTVSQHFGKAPQYLVAVIEGETVVTTELRDKVSHQHSHGHHQPPEHDDSKLQESENAAKDIHLSMSDAIKDCEVVIAGGMGWGARNHMQNQGLQVIMTDIKEIDLVIKNWIKGILVDQTNLNH
ncbi:MAG: NifB/NifX family molybdenum-iron cluster-binding protein [Anaerolineaceae bacterium]